MFHMTHILLKIQARDFCDGPVVKNPPANEGTWVWSLLQEDSYVPWGNSARAPAITSEAHVL